MAQIILGGVLASVLLGLYVWAIVHSVGVAHTGAKEISTDMSYLLNAIGGLISAAVVGLLGATKAGELPAQKTIERATESITGRITGIVGLVPSLFILVWIISGVAMVYFGFSLEFEPLTTQAKNWLGTAIGAVYAYLGIGNNGR
jgi:hypothetical protein